MTNEKTNRRERIRVYKGQNREGLDKRGYVRERSYDSEGVERERNYNVYDGQGSEYRKRYDRNSQDGDTGRAGGGYERRPGRQGFRNNNDRNNNRYGQNRYQQGFNDKRDDRMKQQRYVDGNKFSYSDFEGESRNPVDGNVAGGHNSYRSNVRRPSFGGRNQQNKRPGRTTDYDPNAKYSKKKQIIYKELNVNPDEPIRLNKYIANSGICSRREADELIQSGAISVNGEVITELGVKVKRSDVVKFHERVVTPESKVYILLNKPKNYVTTSEDPEERNTVLDLVKDACSERVYPVGRLDRNTTGVLLLTNDGELASKLTHPKFLKKKIYSVKLDKPITPEDMQKLRDGITLEDGDMKVDNIDYVNDEDKDKVGVEIHSGKNRIVRRLFEAVGYHVKQLDRVFFAGLTKKNLKRGSWRFLTQKEVNMLKMGAFE